MLDMREIKEITLTEAKKLIGAEIAGFNSAGQFLRSGIVEDAIAYGEDIRFCLKGHKIGILCGKVADPCGLWIRVLSEPPNKLEALRKQREELDEKLEALDLEIAKVEDEISRDGLPEGARWSQRWKRFQSLGPIAFDPDGTEISWNDSKKDRLFFIKRQPDEVLHYLSVDKETLMAWLRKVGEI